MEVPLSPVSLGRLKCQHIRSRRFVSLLGVRAAMNDSKEQRKLAILVGGGPAPGINSVIASATIEAVNCGLRVIGLRDGFRWLVDGDTSHAIELGIKDVSRIHFTGG